MEGISVLKSKIEDYRRKYYLNSLIKGTLQFLIAAGLLITSISLLEHLFWFDSPTRAVFFFASLAILLFLLSKWIVAPLAKYFHLLPSELSDLALAEEIGREFPDVKDKLVNALQLQAMTTSDNSLVLASIETYLKNLKPVPFTNGINYRVNLVYVKYSALIMLSMVAFSLFIPGIYSYSTKRVLSFKSEFVKPMPFNFIVQLENSHAFRNEPFEISAELTGNTIPDRVYINTAGRKILMQSIDKQTFTYSVSSVSSDLKFTFEGGGFESKEYLIPVYDRPSLSSVKLSLDYPSHTGKVSEAATLGRLVIPEGTTVSWTVNASAAQSAALHINDSLQLAFQNTGNQVFIQKFRFDEPSTYEIKLQNTYGENQERSRYQVETIPDEYPELSTSFYLDTVLYEYVIISGEAIDDYGIQRISLSATKGNKPILHQTITRPKNLTSSSFYYQLSLDSLIENQSVNNQLSLYASVTDNDYINNFKTTRSESFIIKIPKKEELSDLLDKKAEKTTRGLQKSAEKAHSINDKIRQLQERLMNKKELDWQEEKLLEQLLEQRKKIEEEVRKLQQQFEELNNAENKFNDRSEQIKEKSQQLQKLMNEVLDDETKKMYEDLQKLMEENAELSELQEQLSDLSGNEKNLENELERALELFKRLKVESALEKASDELQELSEEQKQLAEKSEQQSMEQEEKPNENPLDEDSSELANEQEELNESFEDLQEDLEKIQELNQELKNPEPLEDLSDEMQDIQQGLEDAKEMLDQKNFKEGIQKQKDNSQKLQQLAEQMAQMTESMQIEMISEDIDNLRNILDNLVKLSFQQEDLIEGFYDVKQVDPRFVELSQDQLKLKNDAQILEDSLLALSERVAQMSSYITREVALMNENINASLTNLRNRDRNKALSNQQFAMTSINNLALLLDDLLQQMQNSMASGMGKGKPQDKKGEGMPNLKELQKKLSQDIQQLKEGGIKGRKLSENLAKIAAQQEILREKLNELNKSLKGQPGGDEAGEAMEKAMKLMEQNEIDLVNKRLTQQLIDRQEDIMTRMLDAENAMKEQEFDNERKGQTADDFDQNIPKAFQEYLIERKKQIELQKTIPVDLNPFYKKEVNEYFRRLSTEN